MESACKMATRKKSPLVSVIIPTYNRGWILQEAIESVLAQEFDDFELIVVDDGSTDNTRDILNQYKEDILICRQPHQGVSAARNRGLDSASGSLIAFLDSDDLWLPDKLSAQIAFFDSHAEALICQTGETWIRNRVRVNPKKRHQKFSGDIFQNSLALCLISPSAVMLKRSLFKEVGAFDESLPACEDYDFWLRISCRYPVYLIDTLLVIKRNGHADQLSRLPALDKYRIRALQKIIESDLLSKSQYQAAVKTLQEKCAIYSQGCRKRGRKSEASEYIRMSETYSATVHRS